MKRWFCRASVVVLFGMIAQAQQGMPSPPAVIRIFEENVKVGKIAAHEKLETNWMKTFAAAKCSSNRTNRWRRSRSSRRTPRR